jgi:hypothetical protein
MINPFKDNLPVSQEIRTASSVKVLAAEASPSLRNRGWVPTNCESASPRTYHWPLWDSDHIVDAGDGDGRFALTWCDYGAVFYCPVRQTVNLVALPISTIVDPPWAMHASDGRVSAQTFGMSHHDASPSDTRASAE